MHKPSDDAMDDDSFEPARLTTDPDELPRGVNPPRQRRSQDTIERIVAAATQLLDGRSFDEIPVLEIVEQAGVSTSSFYARFPNKAVLLTYLHERHLRTMREAADDAIANHVWDAMSVSDIVRMLVTIYLTHRRAKEPLLRTFMHAALEDPSYLARRTASDQYVVGVIADYLETRLAKDGIPLDFERIALVVLVITSAIKDATNAPEQFAARFRLRDDALVNGLTAIACAHFGVPNAGTRHA